MENSQKGGWVRGPGGAWHAAILFWSLIVLAGLVYPHIKPNDAEVIKIMRWADFAACGFFLADVLWRWAASPHKLLFWKWGWIDLVSSIPYLPWLRWGRIMGVIRIIRAARSAERLAAFFVESRFNGTLMASGAALVTSIWLSSILILHFESGLENATIKTAFDAVWWSIDTVSTVGYGTVFPVSHAGKLTAMALMLTGISLFSVNSGLWASWLVHGIRLESEKMRKKDLQNRAPAGADSGDPATQTRPGIAEK